MFVFGRKHILTQVMCVQCMMYGGSGMFAFGLEAHPSTSHVCTM